MKGLTVLLAMIFVLMGASIAFADCDPTRWTDPSNYGKFPPVGENMYICLDDAGVNSNGNIQIRTVTLVNKDGVCTIGIEWEICCERQESRVLKSRSFYDKDWPTDKDSTLEGDKVWKNYNGNMPIGKAANQFCGRKNQLRKLSPGEMVTNW